MPFLVGDQGIEPCALRNWFKCFTSYIASDIVYIMDLFDAVCLTIWWTEGTKARIDKRWRNTFNYSVEVTNTDHGIIKMFLRYLR